MATAATALGSSELILLPAIVLPVWIALLCFAVVLVQKNEAEQKEVTEVRWVVGGTVRWADAELNIPCSTIIFQRVFSLLDYF